MRMEQAMSKFASVLFGTGAAVLAAGLIADAAAQTSAINPTPCATGLVCDSSNTQSSMG